jgi:Cu(I)-responsive transcriptional regulator
MNIGEAAAASGLPPKTIRYYEEIGLVTPRRAANGYRDYGPEAVRFLGFVARARGLGFSVEDCRALLSLYRDRDRASGEVRAIAEEHLAEIDRKLDELQSMRRTLAHLVATCHGDDRPDCPILDQLAMDGDGVPGAQCEVVGQPDLGRAEDMDGDGVPGAQCEGRARR